MSKRTAEYKTPSKYFDVVPQPKGRPRLKLNEDGAQMVEVLAGLFCTDEEMAGAMKCSVECLLSPMNRELFAERKKTGLESGKCSLRRKQFKLADKSAAMAIFLGKNYLGQTDGTTQKLEITGPEQNQLVQALKHAAVRVDENDGDTPEGMEALPSIEE